MRNSGFEFFIDLAVNCVFVRHYGVFDLDTTIARGKAISADHSYRADLNRIIDSSGCTLELTSEDLRTISEFIGSEAASRGTYREAILIDSLLGHGLVRILDGHAPSPTIEFQIFDTRKETANEEVRNWLNIMPDHPLPEFINL